MGFKTTSLDSTWCNCCILHENWNFNIIFVFFFKEMSRMHISFFHSVFYCYNLCTVLPFAPWEILSFLPILCLISDLLPTFAGSWSECFSTVLQIEMTWQEK